jgi:integrase
LRRKGPPDSEKREATSAKQPMMTPMMAITTARVLNLPSSPAITAGSPNTALPLVEHFGDRSIEQVTQFELQIHLNRLAKEFSDSIVRHAFSNIKSIFRTARKMKFIVEDPAEDLLMPDTRVVKKPKIEPRMILDLIESIPDPRERALLAVGCFCGPRTSENFGLTWKSYADDHLIVYDTAYEGALYERKVKTEDSRARIPIPHRIRPYIELGGRSARTLRPTL